MQVANNLTRYETIHKDAGSFTLASNLADYRAARKQFTWEAARKALDGLPDQKGLNIAYEAVDRHGLGERDSRVALRWIGKTVERQDYSYGILASLTNCFANVLQSLGVSSQDRVFVLLGRVPELYIAMLGALKNKCVVSPLFSAFGPKPIATRMEIGEAKVLVTTDSLYRRKIEALTARLPTLEHVILVDASEDSGSTRSWSRLMKAASPDFEIPATDPQDVALLHFTSGTTGRPKGVIHVHEAVVTHYATGLYALDLHEDDRFWCTADPGWVTGTSYGVIAPLTHGVTNIVVEAEFDAPTWYGVLAQERVTV